MLILILAIIGFFLYSGLLQGPGKTTLPPPIIKPATPLQQDNELSDLEIAELSTLVSESSGGAIIAFDLEKLADMPATDLVKLKADLKSLQENLDSEEARMTASTLYSFVSFLVDKKRMQKYSNTFFETKNICSDLYALETALESERSAIANLEEFNSKHLAFKELFPDSTVLTGFQGLDFDTAYLYQDASQKQASFEILKQGCGVEQ